MRVARVRETFAAGDTFTFWPISDTHLGAADTDEDTLRAHVDMIAADPMARWVFLGDCGDLISPRDKRYHPGMLPQRYHDALRAEGGIWTETVEHNVEVFEKIKDKCWAWLSGNHEGTIRKHYDRELGSEIAGRLGVEYLGYGGFLKVDFAYDKGAPMKDRAEQKGAAYHPLVFDLHHGWQGGRRKGAKINTLELDLGATDADIVLRGHSHDRVMERFDCFTIGSKHVSQWPRIVAHCGTYKTGHVTTRRGDSLHDTWEHTKGFREKFTLGPPLLDIKPRAFVRNSASDNARFEYTIRH